MEKKQHQILVELFWVWLTVIVLSRIFYELRFIPFFANNLMVFTGLALVYVPVVVLSFRKESIDFFEKSWSQFFSSLKLTFFLTLILFTIFAILNHYYQKLFFNLSYQPSASLGFELKNLGQVFFFHLLLVAFPEEFFFRGYFLKRMRAIFSDKRSFFGVKIGWAFFLTALIFAFSHSLITVRWWHFSIFFPALVFGWLREKTGGLTAPILFHALCNVFAVWVGMHYR